MIQKIQKPVLYSHDMIGCKVVVTYCFTFWVKTDTTHSSPLYIYVSWKWQLIQVSINFKDTAQELNGNHMQEETREEDREMGGGD